MTIPSHQPGIEDELHVLSQLFPDRDDLSARIERACIAIEQGGISGICIYEQDDDHRLWRGFYSYLIDPPQASELPENVERRASDLIWKVGRALGMQGTTPIEYLLFWSDVRPGQTHLNKQALRTVYEVLGPLRPLRLLTLDEMIVCCSQQSPEGNVAVAGSWGRDPLAVLHNHSYQARHLEWFFPSWYHPALARYADCYSSLTRDQNGNHFSSEARRRGRFDLEGTIHQRIIELIDQRYLTEGKTHHEMTAEMMLALLQEVKALGML